MSTNTTLFVKILVLAIQYTDVYQKAMCSLATAGYRHKSIGGQTWRLTWNCEGSQKVKKITFPQYVLCYV